MIRRWAGSRDTGQARSANLATQSAVVLLLLIYTAIFSWLLFISDGRPYAMDANESFSVLLHASNLYHFDFAKSFGLTDEAVGPDRAAHPYVYTHNGNFPRLFGYLLYSLGARSAEHQILFTLTTVGLAAVLVAFGFFCRVTARPWLAFMICVTLMTDYVFVTQWHVVTFRVWHPFLLFLGLFGISKLGDGKDRIWLVVIALNQACLWYYDLAFALYGSVFLVTYGAWRCRNARRELLTFVAVVAAGSCISIILLLVQLFGYLGLDGLLTDLTLTYLARNHTSDPEAFRNAYVAFARDHNLVAWMNFRATSIFVSPAALVQEVVGGTLFTYMLPVYTPLLTVVVGALFAGMILEHVKFRFSRHSRASGGNPHYEAGHTRLLSHVTPMIGKLALLALGYGLLLVGLTRQDALFGQRLADPPAAEPGPVLLLVAATLLSLGTYWLSLDRVQEARGPSFTRIILAAVMLVGIGNLVAIQPAVYDQRLSPIWLTQIDSDALRWISRGIATGASFLAAIAVLFPISDDSDGGRTRSLYGLGPYLVLGLTAHVITYLIFPGQIVSGYLERSLSPLAYIFDAAIALALYWCLSRWLRPCFRMLRGTWILSAKGAHSGEGTDCGGGSLHRPTLPFRLGRDIVVASITLMVFGFTATYWLRVQWTYYTLFPPTQFEFLTRLREPPYVGASFATNLYGAPISAMTGQWSYIDYAMMSGNVHLTDRGYQPARSADLLWLADHRDNLDYQHPEYYACMLPPTWESALRSLGAGSRDRAGCTSVPLVHAALVGHQPIFQHRIVARDETPSDAWAIVRLDWDQPPYLARDDGRADVLNVDLEVVEGRASVRVEYLYRQQQGKPEDGTIIEVRRADDGTVLGTASGAGGATIMLQPDVDPAATIQVSVTPKTATKAGAEYISNLRHSRLESARGRDDQRKIDLRALRRTLIAFHAQHGRFPCTGDNVWRWSTSGAGWLWDDPPSCPRALGLQAQGFVPTVLDPTNNGTPFWRASTYVYGYREHWSQICPERQGQFFVIAARLEDHTAPDGRRVVRDCDGTPIPWPEGTFALTSEEEAQPAT